MKNRDKFSILLFYYEKKIVINQYLNIYYNNEYRYEVYSYDYIHYL